MVIKTGKVVSTAQKMKFSIKDFFSKCDQIRSFLRIWSHLLKKSLMENFIFCAVEDKEGLQHATLKSSLTSCIILIDIEYFYFEQIFVADVFCYASFLSYCKSKLQLIIKICSNYKVYLYTMLFLRKVVRTDTLF